MKTKLLLTTVVVTMAVSLQSCTSEKTIESSIVIDISKTVDRDRFPDTNTLYQYILKQIGYDKKKDYFGTGVDVRLSYIGTDRHPKIIKVSLEKGSGSLLDNHKNRKKLVEDFLIDLKGAIGTLLEKPSNHYKTRLASSVNYQVNLMRKNSFSDIHYLILITDGLEDDKINLKHSIVSHNGNGWKEKATQELNKIYPLGDLSSFEITYIPCPLNKYRSVSEDASQYWIERFRIAGAKAEIIGNLF